MTDKNGMSTVAKQMIILKRNKRFKINSFPYCTKHKLPPLRIMARKMYPNIELDLGGHI